MSNAPAARTATAQAQNGAPLLRADGDGVATLTLNRPAQRNALSLSLMDALRAELAGIADDPAVKVVVIAGAGPAFCAGHDLRELRGTPTRARPHSRQWWS